MTAVEPAATASTPILAVEGLVKHFPVRSGFWRRQTGVVHAVCGVDLVLAPGETLGLVGESGSGKSTVGRCVLRLIPATAGTVRLAGEDLSAMSRSELRAARRRLQIVFQDPYASLNPRQTVGATLAEPLKIHGRWDGDGPTRIADLLERVGLSADHAARYPHEFSGGQRQRIGVARAIALDPEVLVLDEPVSALDVSIQAGVVNLLEDLQSTLGLAYLFVAHDLSVVRHISDRVAVMYLGKVVETGPRDEIYERPAHPYTRALLSAVPVPDPRIERRRQRILLEGDPPDPTDPPSGCRFRTRCPLFHGELTEAERRPCMEDEPALVDHGAGHPAACHFASRVAAAPAVV